MKKTTKSLNKAWKERTKLYAEGNKLRKEGDKLCIECYNLFAEGNELRVEGDKLRVKGYKLRKEGNKLRAEGYQLRAKADNLWTNAVIAVYGNIKIEWKNWDEKTQVNIKKKIKKITECKSKINVYNIDALDLIHNIQMASLCEKRYPLEKTIKKSFKAL